MKVSHTDLSGVTLEEFINRHWQHKDRDGRFIGPIYPTKAEALADTRRYVFAAGLMPHTAPRSLT